jgi:hypothetical protein
MRNFDPVPGELWIVDRGYANPPSVQSTVDRHADLLVRYCASSLPLFDGRGRRIDVLGLISRTTRRQRAKGRKAYVHTREGRVFPVRLCWMRLSAPDAAKARARVERDGGDSGAIDAAEYVVVVTTVPRSRLSDQQVIALYRARWQVELDFKRDKSIGQLDTLPSERPDTIRSWLCAKVLLGLVARRLASQQVSIPPCGIGEYIFPQAEAQARSGRRRGSVPRTVVRDATGVGGRSKRSAVDHAA